MMLPDILYIKNTKYVKETNKPTLWRVKHDKEIGKIWRAGLPEVHTLFVNPNTTHGNHFSPFQKWAQELSRQMNLWMADDIWTKIYHASYWISNGQGFGMKDSPRANFITGENLNEKLPKVEALTCGGSLLEGERLGDWVKVKGLHFNTPVSLDFLKSNPQYWTRGVYSSGTGKPFRMLGHKFEGGALIHPLIVDERYGLYIQSYKLQQWTSPELPDPLKLYLA